MIPFELDDEIPFVQRAEHRGQTIREIIRNDSGYLKDLFLRDERLVFSYTCFSELKRLTKGHIDNWERPKMTPSNIFHALKTYRSPYLYDFNDNELEKINIERLQKI